jgi:hypothetical protein
MIQSRIKSKMNEDMRVKKVRPPNEANATSDQHVNQIY